MEVVIIITWVEVEEVEVIVEQVEQAEERGEAQILNIKSDANSKYQILEVLGPATSSWRPTRPQLLDFVIHLAPLRRSS